MATALQMCLPPSVAENPQQEQEKIDEVEVERQRSDHRDVFLLRAGHCGQLLQFLIVPGGEAEEDEDADDEDDERQCARANKDVHDTADDKADQSHEEK